MGALPKPPRRRHRFERGKAALQCVLEPEKESRPAPGMPKREQTAQFKFTHAGSDGVPLLAEAAKMRTVAQGVGAGAPMDDYAQAVIPLVEGLFAHAFTALVDERATDPLEFFSGWFAKSSESPPC